MEEKVVIMILKVDLECSRCYKKVKKVISKFPQIRDQLYNEKQNTVTIKVVCCKPEKIRDKMCCKGGGSIKSIEIKEPEKPKPAEPEKKKEPEKPKPAEPEKKKEPEKPKSAEPEKKKEPEKPKAAEPEKKKEPEKQKAAEPEKKKETVAKMVAPPVQGYPPVQAYQFGVYYGEGGGGTAPSYYGMPAPPPCYVGRPVYDSYGGGNGYYVNNCDYYNQDNSTGCVVM